MKEFLEDYTLSEGNSAKCDLFSLLLSKKRDFTFETGISCQWAKIYKILSFYNLKIFQSWKTR